MAEQPDKAGLTPSEKDIVRNTWDVVKKDLNGNGVDLFIRLFTAHPEYQQKFKLLKNIPISELKGNKNLLAHATNVMYTITMLVENIEHTEVLVEMLKKLGRDHYRRTITVKHFENLKLILMALLKDKVGTDLMNDKAVAAWDKTYAVIVSVVKIGLEEAEKGGE
jgi:hemoglobin-like flavoprotein